MATLQWKLKECYHFLLGICIFLFKLFTINCLFGGVPEWLNGTVSKIVVGATSPRVRIPAPPPSKNFLQVLYTALAKNLFISNNICNQSTAN